MRGNKKHFKDKKNNQARLLNSKLKIPISQYSKQFKRYMMEQFSNVDRMIKKIIQMPCCHEYYLKYPLEGLMRGAIKKMMLNTYEVGVFGYFLEQKDEWTVSQEILLNLYEIFPDIIHVNEPTCPKKLKQISMFLYFSCFSVKQFLNENIDLYKKQMKKIFPQFEHLHQHWVNTQDTIRYAINPRDLNQYLQLLEKNKTFVDYNTCVDKVIQISPCYDLSGKNDKKKIPNFGFMQQNNSNDFFQYNLVNDSPQEQENMIKEEEQIEFELCSEDVDL